MDYPIHLFNHRALGRSDGGVDDALRRVWPGIALGGLTTIVGFGGLALSDFPGIQEVGVFAIAGVLGALCATRWWVPSLAPETWPVTRLQRRGADALANLLELLRRRRLWIAALPLSAVVLTAVALPTLVWQDDVTALADRSEVLLAEDGRVRARVGGTEPGRVIAAVGDTWEQAVARNDAAAALLEGLVAETPELRARSVHALLWSEALQRRNLEAVAAAPDLAGRMNDALTAEGFVPEAFAPFAQDLQAETPPLTYAALEASPVGRLIRPFAVKVDGRPALLTFLRGGGELEELRRGLGPLDGVHVFDQRAFLSAAFAEHRARTLELILLGLAGVFFVVLGRYRRLGPSVAAFAPAVLAAGVAAAILALMGTALHLLHLASLLLVLSMGVDYGVFLVESARQSTGLAATMASIVVAAVSTLLGFGLLALSDNPALRAIGVTTTLGILASVVLAPTALLLVGEET